MVKGLYTAYTGMLNEQHRMDVLTNNLANVDTSGFKKEGSTSQAFDSVLAYKIKDTSYAPTLAKGIGKMNLGVKIGENYTDYSQGAFKVTNRPYDLAISGTGFFNIEFTNKAGDKSTKYTRDGSFTVNTEGYLVTKDGDFVLDNKNARIKVDPNTEVVINSQGTVSQDGRDLATIKITDFEDYNYLEHYGENYYQPVEGATEVPGQYTINQGYLEASNVQTVQEMVEMITVQRQYESNQKMIQTIDASLEVATKLGRV